MCHPDSVICRTFRGMILLLAALVIAVSCMTWILRPRSGPLQSQWHGDPPTSIAAVAAIASR